MAQPEPSHGLASNGATGSAYAPSAAHSSNGNPATQFASSETVTIGKGLVIRGEISGDDCLVIDGRAEGSIQLTGSRVTVGPEGVVAANISAREVIILGKVRGNVTAEDRVDIRGEGSVIGDMTAPRISIEDGAYFKGGIDVRKPNLRDIANAPRPVPRAV